MLSISIPFVIYRQRQKGLRKIILVSEFEQQVAKLCYSFNKIVSKDLVGTLGKYKNPSNYRAASSKS